MLEFSVSGISAPANFKSSNTSAASSINQEIVHKEHETFETLNYVQLDQPKSPTFKNGTDPDTLRGGVKYRVELYEVVGNDVENHIKTLNLVSKAAGSERESVSVSIGKTYKWFAYSYNTTDDITVPNGQLIVPMGENKDFIFADGEISIDEMKKTRIEIVFERKTARVAIDIDARGLSADAITDLQVEVPKTIIKTGNFDLENKKVNDLSDLLIGIEPNLPFRLNDFENVDGAGNNYRKVVYLHSAASINQNQNFLVTNLTYNVSNGFEEPVSKSPIVDIPFNFKDVNIQIGQSGSLKADFLMKGIPNSEGIEWAPSNLYMVVPDHDLTDAPHNYRFYPHNNLSTDYRTYFSFGSDIPWDMESNGRDEDPCGKVYPKGRWKTPAMQDFKGMVTSIGIIDNTVSDLGNLVNLLFSSEVRLPANASIDGNTHIKYTFESSEVKFPANGYIARADLVNIAPPTLSSPLLVLNPLGSLGSHGKYINLLTSSEAINLTGLVSASESSGIPIVSTYLEELLDLLLGDLTGIISRLLQNTNVGYVSYFGSITTPNSPKARIATNLLDFDAIGEQVISTGYMNIRCIKNTLWKADESIQDLN